jgi:hypothetical protein
MKGHGSQFSRKKEQAIAALLTERNVDEAARSVRISTATLMRWQKDPEFQAAYREARSDAFGQCIARLQKASSAATTTLLNIMVDRSAPPACRLRAAESVLSLATKATEMEDVVARLSQLERKVGPSGA